MKRWTGAIVVGLATVALVACSSPRTGSGGSGSGSNGSAAVSGTAASSNGNSSNANTTDAAAQAPAGSVSKVVDEVRPAVVKIDVANQAQNQNRAPFGFGGGGFGGGIGSGGLGGILGGGLGGNSGSTQESGTGTGIILDNQGHILTNNHVVTLEGSNPASSITVTLANGKTPTAKVVGRDPQTDLAVVQVDASQLTGTEPLQWANPSSIIVGEPVVAIGYALDLAGEPTVTTGVVSATNRAIDEPNATISGAIQTDAAINPGNSGGPLVDMSGHLIGINAAGLTGTPDQPAQGLNFAISVQTAKPVEEALISKGQVTRGYMGVEVTNITPELAQAQNLPVKSGAGVGQVTSGSPAEQAGLQAGDIITKVGNTTIQNVGDLTTALTDNGPGTKVPVTYYRGNSQKSADITLGTRPAGS